MSADFYAALKQAIAVLSPTPASDIEAAAALNAQTVTLDPQDVNTGDAAQILRATATGELFALYQLSLKSPSGTSPPSTQDQQIAAAWTTYQTLTNSDVLAVADPTRWAICQSVLTLLGPSGAGVISQSSLDAITSLRTPTTPKWDRVITTDDIAATRS